MELDPPIQNLCISTKSCKISNKQCMNKRKFGEYCGKHKDGKRYKPAHYVFGWAKHKGWREDLDLTNPQSEQIDNLWNPHKIFAKTKTTTNKNFSPQGFKKASKLSNTSIKKSNLIKLKNGQIVKHEKFGTGKVINIEGEGPNKKATVFFNGIGNKQLLLKFARLEIMK